MRRLFALFTCLATLGGLVLYSTAGQAQDNKPCNNNSEQCMISAASTYLDALVSHDATHIRLAPDHPDGTPGVVRTEQGVFVTKGAAAIRKSVTPPTGDQIIIDRRDTRWFVDKPNNEAVAFYILDIGSTIPPTDPAQTVHLSERFKVDNGLITQIEAIFSVGTKACEPDNWPPDPGSAVCPPPVPAT